MTTLRTSTSSPSSKSLGPLPRRWGEGGLFAFSGIDGTTHAASGMVATLGADRWTLLLHTPARRTLTLGCEAALEPTVVTGDVLQADGLAVTWAAWHTLVGELPAGAAPALTAERPEARSTHIVRGHTAVTASEHDDDAIVLAVRGRRFSLSFGRSLDEADQRAAQALNHDIPALMAARLAWFDRLPALSTGPDDLRLAAKLASVMKVNTLSPEGPFTTRWSTPDRVPHRDLWLWDSAFHSLGMNHLDPDLAWDFLRATLDTQQPDGLIPHQTAPTGWQSPITQPPVLAWAVWENFRITGREDRAAHALPALLAYLQWDLDHRDRNRNGLLEWAPTGQHAGCESGMDNSPRFDRGPVDAVDFNTFLIHDLRYLAKLADALTQPDTAQHARQLADDTAHRLHTQLWNPDRGTYADRDADTAAFSPTRAVSDFLPLLLDDLPHGRARLMLDTLQHPDHFATANPLPSVARSDPAFGTDMWRGATWVNTNHLVALGLRRQGFPRAARHLEDATLRIVADGIDRFGVTFEFYDAERTVDPTDLDRKGPRRRPYDLRNKMDSIRDYHWTAALALDILVRHATPGSP